MTRAAGAGALGAVLLLFAALFDAEALYAPGIALPLAAAAGVLWVRLAARGAQLDCELSARRVAEGEALAVRLVARRSPGSRIAQPPLRARATHSEAAARTAASSASSLSGEDGSSRTSGRSSRSGRSLRSMRPASRASEGQ